MAILHKKENWSEIWELRTEEKSYKELNNFFQKKVYSSLLRNLTKKRLVKGDVLEIGCGSGYLSMLFLSNGAHSVALLDRSEKALIYSKNLTKKLKIRKRIKWVQSDCKILPFKDGSFNLVHSTGLLEHFSDEDIFKILKEVNRVLKEKGNSIMITPRIFSPEIIWRILKYRGKGTERLISKKKLKDLLIRASFHNVRVERAYASVIPSFINFENWLTKFIDKNFGFMDYLIVTYGEKI